MAAFQYLFSPLSFSSEAVFVAAIYECTVEPATIDSARSTILTKRKMPADAATVAAAATAAFSFQFPKGQRRAVVPPIAGPLKQDAVKILLQQFLEANCAGETAKFTDVNEELAPPPTKALRASSPMLLSGGG